MILVTGGSASGKSAFAEKLAMEYSCGQKLYIATMKPYDKECEERIRKHRLLRQDKCFVTEECYELSLANAYASEYRGKTGLFECMSNYVSNVMFGRQDSCAQDRTVNIPAQNRADTLWEEQLAAQMVSQLLKVDEVLEHFIIVTNEVFSDGNSYDPVTIQYQQILGDCNRRLAKEAELVYEVVCGIAVKRKS
jgi:adenosylcobinamide kinase/adenosylcobinamide-phosphate guanylyltransferase